MLIVVAVVPVKRDLVGILMCIANFSTSGLILVVVETQVLFG